MKTEIEVNGKPVLFPTAWEDVRFGQWCELLFPDNDGGISKFLSVLTDLHRTEIETAIMDLNRVCEAVQFYNTAPVVPDTVESITLNGTNISIAYPLKLTNIIQVETIAANILKLQGASLYDMSKAYASHCALFLQPIIDSCFDKQRAQALTTACMELPCQTILSLGPKVMKSVVDFKTGGKGKVSSGFIINEN